MTGTQLGTQYRVLSLMDGGLNGGPFYPSMMRDVRFPDLGETYRGDAHAEARKAGISTCLEEEFFADPMQVCTACAVEAGTAIMVKFDYRNLEHELRDAYKRRAHIQAQRLAGTLPKPEVTVLALCEQEALVLKPGVLYRFEVVEGCAACAQLART